MAPPKKKMSLRRKQKLNRETTQRRRNNETDVERHRRLEMDRVSTAAARSRKTEMMADSSSEIDTMEIQEPDTPLSGIKNGVLTIKVSTSEVTKKSLQAVPDLKENDVKENCVIGASDHAINLSSDEDITKKSVPPEIKVGRKTGRKMRGMPKSRVSTSKNGALEETSDVEAVSSTSENHKDLNSNVNDIKTETDVPADSSSQLSKPDSEKVSIIDVEMSSVKSNAIPDRLYDNSPKCSPELIIADDGPLDRFKIDTNESSPVPSKVDGENEVSENSSKAANDAGSKKSNSKEESGPKVKKEGESGKKKKGKTCPECGLKKKLHFRIVFQGKSHQMCSEACYKNFKQKMTPGTPDTTPKADSTFENCVQCQRKIFSGQGYFPLLGDIKSICSEECLKKYHNVNGSAKDCAHCKNRIDSAYNQLTWETMIFCNEDCLGKYQSFLGSHCTCCQSPVPQLSLGKYCVCFGADIRQFCTAACLEEFKKGLKVCSYCQTDLSSGTDGFLAPVGDKGQFKDFCSQLCMERYEAMNNTKSAPEVLECSHCKKQGSFKIHVTHQQKTHSLCCDICVAGFRCTNKIQENMCNTCFKFFKPKENENFSFQFEGSPKHFCAKACMTLYVLSHRKIIQCVYCKVKKYTFDMIEKLDPNNHTQVFCSLNCLSLYRVNLNAASSKCICCDNCNKSTPAQYHLTMSDGSIRNFCTYQCVLIFQNQFTAVPALTTSTATRQTNTPKTVAKTTSTGTSPVIVSAISLANHSRPVISTAGKGLVPQTLVTVRQQSPSSSVAILTTKPQVSSSSISAPVLSVANSGSGFSREIVVRPPVPKSVRNKSASCKPIMQTKGVNAKLQTCHKAVQTDERPMPIILPIPIPIYVPTPMHMFSRPIACPVPFPVPIPVPIIVHSKKSNKDKEVSETNSTQSFEDNIRKLAEMFSENDGETQEVSKEATSIPPKENTEPETSKSNSQSEDATKITEKSTEKEVEKEIEVISVNNTVDTTVSKVEQNKEAASSIDKKSEDSNKRKAESEEQSLPKKPKFELTPVSGLNESNNVVQDVDIHSNMKNINNDEANTPFKVT